jgi:hypothetical protein
MKVVNLEEAELVFMEQIRIIRLLDIIREARDEIERGGEVTRASARCSNALSVNADWEKRWLERYKPMLD